MASLPSRAFASFAAAVPIPSVDPLDDEFNSIYGATGFLNGNTTAVKLLVKSSDASDPPIECDQVGAGPLAEWKQNGVLKASIDNSGDFSASGITTAAGIVTFDSIPLGPASNPTTDNQLARKAYVDARLVSSAGIFTIPDPSTATLNSREFGSVVIPAGGVYTVTKASVMFRTGSHTSGGSLTIKVDLAFTGDIATLTLDDTNNTIATLYPDNFGDFTAAAGSIFNAYISARSGTISERDVSVILEFQRTVF